MKNNKRKYKKYIAGGNGKYLSHLNNIILELEKKYIEEESFFDQIRILGEINAIETGLTKNHDATIKLIVEAKKEIQDLSYDKELFSYEINYYRCVIDGTEKVLQMNRSYFEKKNSSNIIPIFIIGLLEENIDKDLFIKMATLYRFNETTIEDVTLIKDNSFFFTTSIEEFIKAVECADYDHSDVAINFIYKNKNFTMLDKVNNLPEVELFRINIVNLEKMVNLEKIFHSLIKNVAFIK